MEDPFFSNLSEEEDPELFELKQLDPIEFKSETAHMNNEEYKAYQLLRDSKRRYLKNRNQSLTNPILWDEELREDEVEKKLNEGKPVSDYDIFERNMGAYQMIFFP